MGRVIDDETLFGLLRQRLGASALPSPTVREVWAKYAAWGERNRKHWYSGGRVHWKHLEGPFGDRQVSTLTLSDADAYRTTRTKRKAGTRNRELSSLRACFSWAVKRKLIPSNPLSGMEQEKEGGGRDVFIDEADFARLVAQAPTLMAALIFQVAFDTGMRRGEILNLEWEQVDLSARLIRLGDGDVKNGDGRIVPLTEWACEALSKAPRWSRFVFSLDGDIVAKSTLNDWFRRARTKAGLTDKVKFHSLRHSCATLMRRRDVSWPLIKAALGWKTDVAAKRYQQYNADDWEQLRQRMNAGIAAEKRRGPHSAGRNVGFETSEIATRKTS